MKSIRIPRGYFQLELHEQECVQFGEAFATVLDFYENRSECLILLFPQFRTDGHDNGLREVSWHAINKQYP